MTQHWYGWEQGLALGGDDAVSYEQIALAAPAFPVATLPFHHAQRIAGPYLIGLSAIASGLDVRILFRVATGACLLLSIMFLGAALSRLGVADWEFAFCMSLFVTNFTLRFYLVVPGMLPDALFICGLALAIYGLAAANLAIVLAGVAAAAAGRQTALLMIPGLVVWMALGEGWVQRPAASKAFGIVAVGSAVIAVYLASAFVATVFGSSSENIVHVTGLVDWLRSPLFSVEGLGIFFGTAIAPLMLLVTVIVAALRGSGGQGHPIELFACFSMAAAIVIQPLLGGPEITNANVVRLAALGIAPLVVAAALVLRAGHPEGRWAYRGPLVVGALVAASFHYNYTTVGPETKFQFAVLQLAVAFFVGYLIYVEGIYKSVSGEFSGGRDS